MTELSKARQWAVLWKRKAKEGRKDARRARREYASADRLFWDLVDTTSQELDALDEQLCQAQSWSALWKRVAKNYRQWERESSTAYDHTAIAFESFAEDAHQTQDELRAEVERLRQALAEQDINWAMLQMHHPHLVGVQRDEIREALGIMKSE